MPSAIRIDRLQMHSRGRCRLGEEEAEGVEGSADEAELQWTEVKMRHKETDRSAT